ncbi:hypothetical protein [Acinetobacter sp. ANC 4648]|uniref:hypothetical protein n=1 Tax=Acinetobacter sp. ANC 4648 TaxID=1977875 RepID=UPI000A34F7B0|nr:hypothetical protein [Acinetobacter sp. ANC 4648]OTG82333.1 hypothetical protein B9T27_08845 [Acinetobacter sp. ANC 4648]
MNKGAIIFSILVATIISIILAFSIFGILYFHWGDIEAVKNSLSTVSSFFGGFATLGAAIIAAYLVADWKKQATYNSQITILANMLSDIGVLTEEFDSLRNNQNMYKFLKSILENEEIKVDFIPLNFNKMNNLINSIRSKYFQLKMLSDQHDVFPQQDLHTNVFLQIQAKLKMFELKAQNIKRLNNCSTLYDDDLKLAFYISGELDHYLGSKYANIERYSISDIYDKFYNLRDAVIHYKKLLDK